MPKHSTDLFVRGQVLAAYAAFEDRSLELTVPDGTIIRRTRIILDNIRRIEEQAVREQLKLYYELGRHWREEVETMVPEEEQDIAVRALWKLTTSTDARIADRVYQLFRYRPEALSRLQGVTKSSFFHLSAAAYNSLRKELTQQGETLRLLEDLVDI
jgi:hypothetical protein